MTFKTYKKVIIKMDTLHLLQSIISTLNGIKSSLINSKILIHFVHIVVTSSNLQTEWSVLFNKDKQFVMVTKDALNKNKANAFN